MSQTIILTGATGFLGSHLLKYLLENSNFNIIVLKRSFSNTSRISDCLKNERVKFVDLDKTPIEKCFENYISAVIHLATDYGRDGDSVRVLESNLIFPVKLLELACKYKVNLFLNTDSYFNKENLSYLYLQNYSLSKKSLNLWLKYYSKKIKVINLVLEHIYGENDNPEKFVSTMIDKIAFKKCSSVDVTYGEQKRDFIYADDVCEAYKIVLDFGLSNKFRYRQFDVGTGVATPIKDLLNKIKEISHSATQINFGAVPYRDDEIMISVADNIDLTQLGWKPKFSLNDGLGTIITKGDR